MQTHIDLVIKTSLAYITKDVCTVAACSNIYIQIFLLKKEDEVTMGTSG